MELSRLLDEKNLKKLEALRNPKVERIVEEFALLCKPDKITVLTDSQKDIDFVRTRAIENCEEQKLAIPGHTVHFDGYFDQGRDKGVTKILMPAGMHISKYINSAEREAGLQEISGFFDGAMKGKEMFICFYCLGPNNSEFSIPALQLTDSAYVVHSENILYRAGYKEFKRLDGGDKFFYFIHSAGELENNVSKNVDKKRIYIDLMENRVLSVNNQYAGNSVGLKKLALRLGIKRASEENWLCEHMFILGVQPKEKQRVTYFTGAFPSYCGKTSTAMLPGQTIIGDDIAYIKVDKDGRARAVNIERGIFGIITDVNQKDDPLIFNALTTPREVIFSNVLVKDGKPYWLNMGSELPKDGFNFSGEWTAEKKDSNGELIPAAHKNARYTIRLSELENVDPDADAIAGVPISGFICGGRDSDTSVPVFESLNWSHGVFIGACLESETTAAVLGKEGERTHNPMANLDFLTIPLSTYIKSHLSFDEQLDEPIRVFATNYFLKENGVFLNGKLDKLVWLMWAEGRVREEFEAIETPLGHIPKFSDLQQLFKQYLEKDYSKEDYDKQFSIRADKLLEKFERIEKIFQQEPNVPEFFWEHLKQQKQRLLEVKEKHGASVIAPEAFDRKL